MQEAFEKIIEKLEEELKLADEEKLRCARENPLQFDSAKGYAHGVGKAIEIVKQEAAAYEECYKDCGDCEAYSKEKHHCPKFCKVIKETVKEIEENNNCWIPCSERLPEESGEYLTWVEYDGDRFIAIDEIDCDGIIKEWNCSTDYKIIAWQPLPQPYQPKGE